MQKKKTNFEVVPFQPLFYGTVSTSPPPCSPSFEEQLKKMTCELERIKQENQDLKNENIVLRQKLDNKQNTYLLKSFTCNNCKEQSFALQILPH